MKIEDFPLAPSGKSGWPWTEVALSIVPPNGDEYPKITLVTPSFNQGEFIEETIRSILLQNYPNLEYIIIDGGSTDNTIEIIKKYEKHLTYWISEKDNGQSDAINKGLKISTGEIFNWLNSDDYYPPGALNKVAKLFADPKVEVVCGQSNIFNSERSFISPQSEGFDVDKNIICHSRINQPATFFRMNIIKELGTLSTQLHYCMDLEWWMKYLFAHGHKNILNTNDVLVNFREHENSKTINQADLFIKDKFILYSGILFNKNPAVRSFDGYKFEADLSKVPAIFIYSLSNFLFFYYLVNYYGSRELKGVRAILPFIIVDHLEPAQQVLFNQIRFRSKYVPSWLYKMFGE